MITISFLGLQPQSQIMLFVFLTQQLQQTGNALRKLFPFLIKRTLTLNRSLNRKHAISDRKKSENKPSLHVSYCFHLSMLGQADRCPMFVPDSS